MTKYQQALAAWRKRQEDAKKLLEEAQSLVCPWGSPTTEDHARFRAYPSDGPKIFLPGGYGFVCPCEARAHAQKGMGEPKPSKP